MEPQIQYAKTKDGVSIAVYTLGEGMPLVDCRASAFRLLLQRALRQTNRSDVLLVSPEELERPEVWGWWRRGRVRINVPVWLPAAWGALLVATPGTDPSD